MTMANATAMVSIMKPWQDKKPYFASNNLPNQVSFVLADNGHFNLRLPTVLIINYAKLNWPWNNVSIDNVICKLPFIC